MISVENVCGFRTNRPAYFEKVLDMMRKSKFTTEWFETNAMDFGAPTRRRRLFMIGHKFMEADAKPTMAKLRADLFMQEAARKRGEKTCRDIYETLSPWINLRGFKGIMVHQLRRRGTAKDRPPRIIGIHRSDKLRYGGLMPTITSKYRQSAKQLRDYKHRPGVDEASKDKTHLADGQDLSCLQGLARRTQWSEARRCHDECPGCFLPPTTSRPDSRSSRGIVADLNAATSAARRSTSSSCPASPRHWLGHATPASTVPARVPAALPRRRRTPTPKMELAPPSAPAQRAQPS